MLAAPHTAPCARCGPKDPQADVTGWQAAIRRRLHLCKRANTSALQSPEEGGRNLTTGCVAARGSPLQTGGQTVEGDGFVAGGGASHTRISGRQLWIAPCNIIQ